jgi:hypothetical protein
MDHLWETGDLAHKDDYPNQKLLWQTIEIASGFGSEDIDRD